MINLLRKIIQCKLSASQKSKKLIGLRMNEKTFMSCNKKGLKIEIENNKIKCISLSNEMCISKNETFSINIDNNLYDDYIFDICEKQDKILDLKRIIEETSYRDIKEISMNYNDLINCKAEYPYEILKNLYEDKFYILNIRNMKIVKVNILNSISGIVIYTPKDDCDDFMNHEGDYTR